jgi:hypothetical protein
MADANQTPDLPQVPAPVGQTPDVGAEVDLTSGASQLAQPGYDPSEALSDELSSLRSDLPGYEPPNTSAQDAQIAKYQHTAEESEKLAEGLTNQRSDQEEKFAQELHQQDAQYEQLFSQFPSRQVFYSAGLQSAPLISILGVLGGKASGISGRAMLGAMNGMMEGINSGSEENYQHHLEAWKQQIAAYKERHEQQLEIYNMMLAAYKDRADAHIKARDFALDMTKDTMDERDKVIKNSIDIFKARTEALTNVDKLALLFGQKQRQDAISLMSPTAHEYYMQDVTNKTMPPNLKTAQAIRDYYEHLARDNRHADKFDPVEYHRNADLPEGARAGLAAVAAAGLSIPGVYSQAGRNAIGRQIYKEHPDWTPQQWVDNFRGERAATTVAQVSSRQIGTQESKIVAAEADLFAGPNSFANRVEAAAKKVNFGDAKTLSRIRVWLQGNHWSGDDLAVYLSSIGEFRSKLVTLLQNGGMSTEGAQQRAQELVPTVSSVSALRKVFDNSRGIVQQVVDQNSNIIRALSSGVPIDQIISIAKVPPNRPGQAPSSPSAGGGGAPVGTSPMAPRPMPQTAPGGTQPPQAAPPRPAGAPPATPPAGAPQAPPQQPQAGAQAPRGPRTIQVGAVKAINGVRYRKDADGNWYPIQ